MPIGIPNSKTIIINKKEMNLISKNVRWCFVAFVVIGLVAVSAKAADGDPDAKKEVRIPAVLNILKKSKGLSLLYVKGLVCPSCAIGIRVKVGKLPFVDSTRYKRGVNMDTKTQLLTVALLPGVKAEMKRLSKAISDAGYEVVEWYSLEGGNVKAHSFALAK